MNARIVSRNMLWATWGCLLVLLGLTCLAAQINLGLGNTIVALFISGAKMLLVILFFMQVRYSSRVVWIFAGAGMVWLLIMMSLTMSDYLTRKTVKPYQPEDNVQQSEGARP